MAPWAWLLPSIVMCVMPATLAVAQNGKVYTIYLSNNFNGNDWRQQMPRSAQVAAKKPPLAGRVRLTIDNVETTTQAQISSLNNIIRERPDAILVDAGSGDALNPTIERACKAGIVVVSFDQVVSAPCAFKVSSNFDLMAANQAVWMATMLGGKGKVLMDRGLAGAPVSEQLERGMKAALAKYPGIEVIGYFNGNYALGPEQAGVSNLLAAASRWHSVTGLRHWRNQGVAGCWPAKRADYRGGIQRHRGHVP
jgi:ribose transport system substrate-binding protein